MLSPESAEVIRATASTVVRHGEEITGRFYERMFAAQPDLLDLFNRGNQANGQQRQALAMSVAAVAGHLAGLAPVPLDDIVDRIAHKHASVGIAPAQYTVVGRHLMAAISEVLGDAVTPAVRDAWDEVYWLFACLLVAKEARLYQSAGNDFNRPFAPYRVTRTRQDTPDVMSFWLAPESGQTAHHRPGQYVSVAVQLPGIGRQIRQYSISSAPGAPEIRISVKRHRAAGDRPAGMVSTYLHDQVRPGDALQVSPPFGDLTLPDGDSPLLLASAGVGSTPMISCLELLASTGNTRPITVLHADRGPDTHPLRQEMFAAVRKIPEASLHLWYEHGTTDLPGNAEVRSGLAEPGALALSHATQAVLCGPLPFMNIVRRDLLDRGVPVEHIRYEVFGPDAWLGNPTAEPATA
ncbi:globin domain-containing protein [Actinophytocola sp. NPDC049390]|uniref:globin domain-containing protein n=1 Tax=Actinophytocola sp. NPDC049390 TaxID=3363894 RepID=UPI003794313A